MSGHHSSLAPWTDSKKADWIRSLARHVDLALWLARPWYDDLVRGYGSRFIKHAREVWPGCPREIDRIRVDIKVLRARFYNLEEKVPTSYLGKPFHTLPPYLHLPSWFEPFYTLIYLKYGNIEQHGCKSEGGGSASSPDVGLKDECVEGEYRAHKRQSTTTRDGTNEVHISEETDIRFSMKKRRTENGPTVNGSGSSTTSDFVERGRRLGL